MKFEVDLSDFNTFFNMLTDTKLFEEYAKNALAEVAEQFIQSVMKRTPVSGEPNPVTGRTWNWPRYPDHPKGQLKNAWRKDNPDIRAHVDVVPGGFAITLYNNTEYASFVEKGHRKFIYGREIPGEWVYGSFFLKKTEVEFENGKLARTTTRKINDWIREVANGW